MAFLRGSSVVVSTPTLIAEATTLANGRRLSEALCSLKFCEFCYAITII